jgi:hypothetical protein
MDFSFIEDEELRAQKQKEYNESLSTEVRAAIEKEVTGLKVKNEELLNEKKKLAEKYKDLDPEKAMEALKFIEENETAKLLQEGRFEELIEKNTSQIKSDYEARLEEVTSQLDAVINDSQKYKSLYEKKIVDDEIQKVALKAGVMPEALKDVLLNASSIFQLGEDGSVEARDADGNLKKIDDLILTPENWIKSLKETSPYYWPPSQGAGAYGSGSGSDDITQKLLDLVAKGDMAGYSKLRKKMLAKKS